MIKTFCTPQWETVQPSAFTRHPMLINNEHPLTVPQVGMVVLLYCCDFVINSYHESQLKKTRPNPEDSYVSGMQDTEVTRSLLLWTKKLVCKPQYIIWIIMPNTLYCWLSSVAYSCQRKKEFMTNTIYLNSRILIFEGIHRSINGKHQVWVDACLNHELRLGYGG